MDVEPTAADRQLAREICDRIEHSLVDNVLIAKWVMRDVAALIAAHTSAAVEQATATCEGIYWWRLSKGHKSHKRFVYADAVNALRCMGTLLGYIGGEWSGPLQIVEQPDGAKEVV